MASENETMTVAEVCGAAKVCRATLGRWAKMGLCPSPVKLGPRCLRFRRADIEAWLCNGGVRLHQSGVVPFLSTWLPDEPMATPETLAELDASE